MTPPAVPSGTYRLQLQPGFGFAEAADAVPYLASLGVSHLYLSPILRAVPGSTHGYDVIDHSLVSPELGGETGFRVLAAEAADAGLGIVVDIVPNHMALPTPASLNRQFWSVLAEGPGSPYARWFDIEWDAWGGRVLLPVLGAPVDQVGDQLRVEDGMLRYHEHVFPLRHGTADLPLDEALDAQHYRLADWHEGDLRGNYRRFFTVTSLIGLRQEDEAVFAATHAVILRLVREGLIQGLRVDHPDGLADPRGYLRRLRAATSHDTWIVVEKILTGDERLPADWDCAGTTGYDALRRVDAVFTDPAGADPLRALHREVTGAATAGFGPVALDGKREVLAAGLGAEVARLERVLDKAGVTEADRGDALRELLAAVPVYRPYVVPGEPAPADAVDLMAQALTGVPGRLARTARRIADVALGHEAEPAGGQADAAPDARPDTPSDGHPDGHPGARPCAEFAVRFAQVTSAVAAKGVEDRAFYRWYVLSSRNEVGGEPDDPGLSPEAFHRYCRAMAESRPDAMTALSTHDTKRSEDVRARLAVLAEIPAEWAAAVRGWDKAAARHRTGPGPDRYDGYLLWQTLVGAWPVDADRMTAYLRKAMREAARSTSWTAPDAAYEQATEDYLRAVLNDRELHASVDEFVTRIAEPARAVALGAKLVQLAMPGVPDVYQGGEGVLRTLVDPDNRAPVDFTDAAARLAYLDAGGVCRDLDDEKALVTSAVLRWRRRDPAGFGARGGYAPVHARGPASAHLIGVRRGFTIALATRLPVGLAAGGGWGGTRLDLPDFGAARPGRARNRRPWNDLLTGRRIAADAPLVEVFARLPVALLEDSAH
ncbi:malto-oligosyltrehalose synthase [Yinghuangia seranimata]|uniref:malto-oligosyltrehalose synthase n=1 Tax=Yinghuangia seranimata TaxID=408067 RepID=UPI00248B6678|nr:malto-oligosyltrehalose synthase [Yinghuangia seranimata]MDI2125135.1 malto-oligosyltrehalose synthase [Yinghuangia seranimata]